MPEVVVYLLEGRSLEQKRGLVKDITQHNSRSSDRIAGRDSEDSESQGRRAVQRNGRPLDPRSRTRTMNQAPLAALTSP